MNIRLTGLALAVGASAGWIVACETEQPRGACKASHLSNYGIFDLTSAAGAGECATLTGDFIYMSKYNEPGSTEAQLALTVDTIAALTGDPRIPDFDSLTHLGDYPADPPGADGVCVAQTLSPVTVNIPASGTDPAVNVTYVFSNVRVVSTPLVPGTQWTADLEYTAGGCTATYDVVGISPLVTCNEFDSDGNSILDGGVPIMVPGKCQNPVNLPNGGVAGAVSDFTGETTNLAFDLVCDPKVRDCLGQPCHVCRPNGEVPALH
jgi:hypothetical protein